MFAMLLCLLCFLYYLYDVSNDYFEYRTVTSVNFESNFQLTFVFHLKFFDLELNETVQKSILDTLVIDDRKMISDHVNITIVDKYAHFPYI